MSDLSKMSVEERTGWTVERLVEMAFNLRKHPDVPWSETLEAIAAELTRRMTPPDGHVRLPDGRDVRAEFKYQFADREDGWLEELDVLLDDVGDGEFAEVLPTVLLPHELYVVNVDAHGQASQRLATAEELQRWKKSQDEWRRRALKLPPVPGADAAAKQGGGA